MDSSVLEKLDFPFFFPLQIVGSHYDPASEK